MSQSCPQDRDPVERVCGASLAGGRRCAAGRPRLPSRLRPRRWRAGPLCRRQSQDRSRRRRHPSGQHIPKCQGRGARRRVEGRGSHPGGAARDQVASGDRATARRRENRLAHHRGDAGGGPVRCQSWRHRGGWYAGARAGGRHSLQFLHGVGERRRSAIADSRRVPDLVGEYADREWRLAAARDFRRAARLLFRRLAGTLDRRTDQPPDRRIRSGDRRRRGGYLRATAWNHCRRGSDRRHAQAERHRLSYGQFLRRPESRHRPRLGSAVARHHRADEAGARAWC
jgi:hypothetical protein